MKESVMRLELFMKDDGMPVCDIKMKDEFKNKIFKKNDDKYDEKMLLYMVDFITRALLFSWKIDKEKFKNYFIKHPIDRFEEDL